MRSYVFGLVQPPQSDTTVIPRSSRHWKAAVSPEPVNDQVGARLVPAARGAPVIAGTGGGVESSTYPSELPEQFDAMPDESVAIA